MSKEDKRIETDEYLDYEDPNTSELYQVMTYIFQSQKGKKKNENIPEKLENIYELMNEKLEKNNQILDKRLKNIDTSIKKLCNIIEGFVSSVRYRNSHIGSDDSD